MAPDEAAATAGGLRVEVVYCAAPSEVDVSELRLQPGATLADALHASGVLQRHGLEMSAVRAGVWSRVRPLDTPLRDLDRVEVYRPLLVDPKEARRLRYRGQGRAATGAAGTPKPKRLRVRSNPTQ